MTFLRASKTLHRCLTLAFLFLVTMTVTAQWTSSQEGGGVPAYNAGPPPKGTKLPPILGKDQLWGADAQYPYQTHAYDLAAKIRPRPLPAWLLFLMRYRVAALAILLVLLVLIGFTTGAWVLCAVAAVAGVAGFLGLERTDREH